AMRTERARRKIGTLAGVAALQPELALPGPLPEVPGFGGRLRPRPVGWCRHVRNTHSCEFMINDIYSNECLGADSELEAHCHRARTVEASSRVEAGCGAAGLVRLKRGAAAGCVMPSTSTKSSRARICG